MDQLKQLWRGFFDIRPNERLRVFYVFSYLLLILFAYYILKPLSRALFLSKLEIDKLPWLYILIASVGGFLAYFYTKLAVRASLKTAVLSATLFSVACLVALFFLLRDAGHGKWLYYVLNIWVSLFSIMMVSQGWLIAANVFNPREAKRIYGLLGIGAIIGAGFGGSFAAFATKAVGINNQVLVAAGLVLVAYGAFVGLTRVKEVSLEQAKGAEDEAPADFRLGDLVTAFRQHRHLQVIIGIITLTYIVNVLVEYQNQAMAKAAFTNADDLLQFLGSLYGIYLNFITFFLQFFLTAAVVSKFGVSGTLQIMPVAIGLTSVVTLGAPNVYSTSLVRLSEAATRYTFNRTGMELLYLPLPLELKNRTKAFVDIFVDRFARGMGGVLLLIVASIVTLEVRHVAVIVLFFCVLTIILSNRAKKEYVATVRKRLESRRLDIESVRISVSDPATVQLLAATARSKNERQAVYGLTLLEESQGADIRPLLDELVESPFPGVRGKVFELGRKIGHDKLLDQAMRELRTNRAGGTSGAIEPATAYALAYSGEGAALTKRLLEHPNELVRERTLLFLSEAPGLARELLNDKWLAAAIASSDPDQRAMAALAIRALGDGHTATLVALLRDPDAKVARAAFKTAGVLQDRAFVAPMVERLWDSRLRGAIVDALKPYGERIAGTLGDMLSDPKLAIATRRHVTRVLQQIPHQRSVDALMTAIAERDLTLRSAVLRALHRLRETEPKLKYGAEPVSQQILDEAKRYYEWTAALAPFREEQDVKTPAGLLAKTLEERLKKTVQRLFYLLGLRYPPREIYAAYLAVNRGKGDDTATALEFLESVLDRELKRVLLPLFEAPDHAMERGREIFGLKKLDRESALRTLIESGDDWLVCCAMAAAAQWKMRSLAGDITRVGKDAGADVERMAHDASAQLAA